MEGMDLTPQPAGEHSGITARICSSSKSSDYNIRVAICIQISSTVCAETEVIKMCIANKGMQNYPFTTRVDPRSLPHGKST